MTSKAQTMLTIALTFAVSALLVDRLIEPAQAQNCATSWQVTDIDTKLVEVNGKLADLTNLMVDLTSEVAGIKTVVDTNWKMNLAMLNELTVGQE